MHSGRILIFVFCCLILSGKICFASDAQREAEFADEIMKTRHIGKMIWLKSEEKKFLGLYTETEKKTSKGTVIILHDQGGHPNQQQLIKAMQTFLPEHRWSTLSLQMPVREMGADEDDYFILFPEALARIEAGIKFLQTNQADPIVLAGYGLGALMAVYAQSERATKISALVAISLAVPETQHKSAQTLEFIKTIKVPMLDVFAERDLPEVVGSARNRRVAAKENAVFRQDKINDENHLYQHDEGMVVKRIYSWIERVTAGEESSDKTSTNSILQINSRPNDHKGAAPPR